MPITQARIGMTATFAIGDGINGGSTIYTTVGDVTGITAPGITREAIDATHLQSPEQFREFIAGLLDTEQATVMFNYVPSAADDLYDAIRAGAGDFEITYPGGVRLQFSGIPVSWKPGDPSPDTMKGEFTVKPSGPPTLVAA